MGTQHPHPLICPVHSQDTNPWLTLQGEQCMHLTAQNPDKPQASGHTIVEDSATQHKLTACCNLSLFLHTAAACHRSAFSPLLFHWIISEKTLFQGCGYGYSTPSPLLSTRSCRPRLISKKIYQLKYLRSVSERCIVGMCLWWDTTVDVHMMGCRAPFHRHVLNLFFHLKVYKLGYLRPMGHTYSHMYIENLGWKHCMIPSQKVMGCVWEVYLIGPA